MYKEHISDNTVITTAMATLRHIFVHDETLEEPFHPSIKRRLLIYPYRYHFKNDADLTTALTTIARREGEEGFYFRYFINNPDPDPEFDGLWYIPFLAPRDEYLRIAPLENVCFSPRGTWALMATYEDYGLLGGTDEFMDHLLQLLPDLDTQVTTFVEELDLPIVDPGIAARPLKQLLMHLYGSARARQIFQEANIPYLEDTV